MFKKMIHDEVFFDEELKAQHLTGEALQNLIQGRWFYANEVDEMNELLAHNWIIGLTRKQKAQRFVKAHEEDALIFGAFAL